MSNILKTSRWERQGPDSVYRKPATVLCLSTHTEANIRRTRNSELCIICICDLVLYLCVQKNINMRDGSITIFLNHIYFWNDNDMKFSDWLFSYLVKLGKAVEYTS